MVPHSRLAYVPGLAEVELCLPPLMRDTTPMASAYRRDRTKSGGSTEPGQVPRCSRCEKRHSATINDLSRQTRRTAKLEHESKLAEGFGGNAVSLGQRYLFPLRK
jgi:hypothetical protein